MDDTRTRLLNAARDLFWSGSYGSVSVDDICAKAEVRKGSFYHFFASKAELALAVIQTQWENAKPELEAIVSAPLPVHQQLQNLVDGMVACQQQKLKETGKVQGLLCLNMGQEMGSLNEDIRTKSQEFVQNYIGIFQRLLQNAVQEGLLPASTNLPALASAMWASGMGVIYHAKIHNDVNILKTELPEAWSRFLAPAPTFASNVSQNLRKPA